MLQNLLWNTLGKFNVNGKEEIITTNGSYPTVEGEYVGVETKVIDEGYDAPIKDFSIETADEDLTEQFLNEDHLIMIISYNLDTAESEGMEALKVMTDKAIKNGYTVIGLTASGSDEKQKINADYKLNFNWYLCDEKALKTVVRANPGIVMLHKGTVVQKEHWNDIDDLKLETLPNATPDLNFELKRELDEIYALDQGVREIYFAKTKEEKDAIATKLNLPVQENASDYMKVWLNVDSLNAIKVEKIIKEYGYPGKALVGNETNEVAWFVIQHASADKIAEYLPMMRKATEKGDIPKNLMALMEDRHLMYQGKEQIYGTQGNSVKGTSFIWPIEDPENVNQRRKEIGLDESIEAYAKRLYGDDFVYKVYSLKEINELKKN